MHDHLPDPRPNIFPVFFYRDASAAQTWLQQVFGFTLRMSVPGPEGTVMHSELSLGAGVIAVASAKPDRGWVSPRDLPGVTQAVFVYVDDPDAHYARARAAGAEILYEIADQDYGSREYMALDLEGHCWSFGNYRPGGYWGKPTDEAPTPDAPAS